MLLSYNLSWSQHISPIVTQAHQRLGFLRRNLRGSPFRHRGTVYQALVRSQLEYCCITVCLSVWIDLYKGLILSWAPKTALPGTLPWRARPSGLNESNGRLSAEQGVNIALTSVTRLLKEVGRQDLADRRRHHRLTLLYKILNNHLTVPPEEVSIPRASLPARRTSQVQQPHQAATTTCQLQPCGRADLPLHGPVDR